MVNIHHLHPYIYHTHIELRLPDVKKYHCFYISYLIQFLLKIPNYFLLNILIPHQANLRINQFVQKQLSLPDEKVYNNIC